MVSLMVILFNQVTECFLFVYMHIDLLTIGSVNYLKKVMLTSHGFFFKEANLYTLRSMLRQGNLCATLTEEPIKMAVNVVPLPNRKNLDLFLFVTEFQQC